MGHAVKRRSHSLMIPRRPRSCNPSSSTSQPRPAVDTGRGLGYHEPRACATILAGGKNDRPGTALVLMAAGFQMAAAIGMCTLGGFSLDRRLRTEPWLTLLGLIVGLVVGLMQVMRIARRVQR